MIGRIVNGRLRAEQLADPPELRRRTVDCHSFHASAVWRHRPSAIVLGRRLLLLHPIGRSVGSRVVLGVPLGLLAVALRCPSGLDLADLLQGAGQRVQVVGGVMVASLPQAEDERRGTRLHGEVAQVPEGEEPRRPGQRATNEAA